MALPITLKVTKCWKHRETERIKEDRNMSATDFVTILFTNNMQEFSISCSPSWSTVCHWQRQWKVLFWMHLLKILENINSNISALLISNQRWSRGNRVLCAILFFFSHFLVDFGLDVQMSSCSTQRQQAVATYEGHVISPLSSCLTVILILHWAVLDKPYLFSLSKNWDLYRVLLRVSLTMQLNTQPKYNIPALGRLAAVLNASWII